MNITEEMLRAYVAGCEARDAESADEVDGFAIMRAGLAAAAPLIAAQALRDLADEIDRNPAVVGGDWDWLGVTAVVTKMLRGKAAALTDGRP